MYFHGMNRRGYVHERADAPSQDSLHWVMRNGVAAMCLCDGAGSYPMTGTGARTLARVLSRWMCGRYFVIAAENDDRKLIAEAADVIASCVDGLREKHGVYMEHAFASTALCCAMNAITGEFIALHLGDGLLAGHLDGKFRALTPVESFKADCEGRETLLSTVGRAQLRRGIRISRGRADCILMASDGAEGKLYSPRDNHVLSLGERLLDGMKQLGPRFAQELLERTADMALKSLDDLSIGLMIAGEYPTPEKLGWSRAAPGALRRRRSLRAFEKYARLRDAGMSPKAAAAHAHWGKNRKWKIEVAQNDLNVY